MAGLLPMNENERNYLEEIKAALARSGQEPPQQGSYQPISRSDYPLRDRGKMGLMSEVPPVIEAMGKAGLPITLRGTSKGVGLYAGDETEPIHRTTSEGKTEPYYVASAPPPLPPPPAAEVNTVERVNADFKQRQEAYLEAKRNQAAIIQKGYQLGYSSSKIEEVLKTKGLHKVTEPKHSSWEEEILKSDLKRQEEERKEQTKVGTEEDTAFREWIGKLNILRTKEEPNQAMIQEVENYIKTKFPKSWESYRPTPPPHIPTSIAEWSEGRRDTRAEYLPSSKENIPPTTMPAPLNRELAMQFLQEAGGDKAKARELARQKGFTF